MNIIPNENARKNFVDSVMNQLQQPAQSKNKGIIANKDKRKVVIIHNFDLIDFIQITINKRYRLILDKDVKKGLDIFPSQTESDGLVFVFNNPGLSENQISCQFEDGKIINIVCFINYRWQYIGACSYRRSK